jgi:transcriptional regulator with XRE-family HTH domain
VAKKAGVSKRTVENIESGASAQMLTMIRIFRVLDLMENLDRLIPEPVPKPIDLLKQKSKTRVRASSKKSAKKKTTKTWQWKEDK